MTQQEIALSLRQCIYMTHDTTGDRAVPSAVYMTHDTTGESLGSSIEFYIWRLS
jgi:hypothetical protein